MWLHLDFKQYYMKRIFIFCFLLWVFPFAGISQSGDPLKITAEEQAFGAAYVVRLNELNKPQ